MYIIILIFINLFFILKKKGGNPQGNENPHQDAQKFHSIQVVKDKTDKIQDKNPHCCEEI